MAYIKAKSPTEQESFQEIRIRKLPLAIFHLLEIFTRSISISPMASDDDDENLLENLTVSEMFYQPPPRQQDPPRGVNFTCGDFDSTDTSLLVGDRQWWTRDADLEAELARYGPIKKLRIFYDSVNGMPRVYAQVDFFDPAAAAACREGMDSRGSRGGAHNGFGGMTPGGQQWRPAVLYAGTPVVVGPPRPGAQSREARVSRNQPVWANWGGGGGALWNSGGNIAGMVGPPVPIPPGMLVARQLHPVIVGPWRPVVVHPGAVLGQGLHVNPALSGIRPPPGSE